MKKLFVFIVIVIVFALYGFLENNPSFINTYTEPDKTNNQLLINAFENRQSNLQLGGLGKVTRILPDDREGSRHQKFIVKLSTGQSLLISHNIDLAPRINSLRKNDTVEFYGEYEWNSKGGIIHWTHHDPDGHHEGGWLKHKGSTYQ